MEKEHLAGLERSGFFICSPVDSVRPVTIPEGEEYVEILAGGKLYFEVDGREKEMPLGTVFWHTAGEKTICKTSAKDPYRCYVFLFRVNDGKRPCPRVSHWKESKSVLLFASDCLRTYQSSCFDKESFVRYVYYTLLWHALADENPTMEYPAALRKALRYMDEHFMECTLSASVVAYNSGISRPYLFDLCRKFLGYPPCKYLLEKRVEQAERLLMTSSLPIKDIAEKCGFASLEVFYRSFRRVSGRTPGDYRNTYSVYPR